MENNEATETEILFRNDLNKGKFCWELNEAWKIKDDKFDEFVNKLAVYEHKRLLVENLWEQRCIDRVKRADLLDKGLSIEEATNKLAGVLVSSEDNFRSTYNYLKGKEEHLLCDIMVSVVIPSISELEDSAGEPMQIQADKVCIEMTEVHKSRLREHHQILYENMDTEHSLLIEVLVSMGVLSFLDREEIRSKSNMIDKNITLLHLLQRKPDECYALFKEALVQTGQGHLAELL